MVTNERLIEAVNQSSSMRGVMTYLGYSISGQTSKWLQNQIKELGLEPPTGGSHSRRKRELSDVLVEGSTYLSSNSLKARLVKEGLLEPKCYSPGCSVEDTWNGKPITLQLEHVNGTHDDNRLENLILLCPNCHTQTETWGRKARPLDSQPTN